MATSAVPEAPTKIPGLSIPLDRLLAAPVVSQPQDPLERRVYTTPDFTFREAWRYYLTQRGYGFIDILINLKTLEHEYAKQGFEDSKNGEVDWTRLRDPEYNSGVGAYDGYKMHLANQRPYDTR